MGTAAVMKTRNADRPVVGGLSSRVQNFQQYSRETGDKIASKVTYTSTLPEGAVRGRNGVVYYPFQSEDEIMEFLHEVNKEWMYEKV